MIDHIPELIDAGIDSFKVEGRMKTALYVAVTARVYRRAIDDHLKDPALYKASLDFYREEIAKCTYREFTTGFYFGKPDSSAQIYDNNTYVRNYIYLGTTEEVLPDGGIIIEQKNKFSVGDEIEILKPNCESERVKVLGINDALTGETQESCPHSKQKLIIHLSKTPEVYELLAVKAKE